MKEALQFIAGGLSYFSAGQLGISLHRSQSCGLRSVIAAPSQSSSSVFLQPWMQEVLSFLLLAVLTPPLRRSVSILVPEHTALLLTRTQSEH